MKASEVTDGSEDGYVVEGGEVRGDLSRGFSLREGRNLGLCGEEEGTYKSDAQFCQ